MKTEMVFSETPSGFMLLLAGHLSAVLSRALTGCMHAAFLASAFLWSSPLSWASACSWYTDTLCLPVSLTCHGLVIPAPVTEFPFFVNIHVHTLPHFCRLLIPTGNFYVIWWVTPGRKWDFTWIMESGCGSKGRVVVEWLEKTFSIKRWKQQGFRTCVTAISFELEYWKHSV